MKVDSFTEIADEFIAQVHTIVWCNAATIDRQGRPRSRVLHPIWEVVDGRPIGWIGTRRHTLKTKHLARRPHLSLAYVSDPLKPIYAECHARWADDLAAKRRVWDWFASEPMPLGYNMGQIFESVEDPSYGLLKLTPWRVELADMMSEARTWHAS